jgi:hypothetical protein
MAFNDSRNSQILEEELVDSDTWILTQDVSNSTKKLENFELTI